MQPFLQVGVGAETTAGGEPSHVSLLGLMPRRSLCQQVQWPWGSEV